MEREARSEGFFFILDSHFLQSYVGIVMKKVEIKWNEHAWNNNNNNLNGKDSLKMSIYMMKNVLNLIKQVLLPKTLGYY